MFVPVLGHRSGLLAALVCGILTGCSCKDESHEIQGTMAAVVERDGTPSTADLSGNLYVGNDHKHLPEYETLLNFLTLTPSQTGRATWSLSGTTVALVIQLRGPRHAGDVVTVAGTADGGGWLWEPSTTGPEALVGGGMASFIATEATGSIEVLAVAPMRLRFDVVLRDAGGTTIRVRGDMSFEFVQREIPCT